MDKLIYVLVAMAISFITACAFALMLTHTLELVQYFSLVLMPLGAYIGHKLEEEAMYV